MKVLEEGFLSKISRQHKVEKKIERVRERQRELQPRAPKDFLRDHQIRVLRCLNNCKGALTRGKIAKRLEVSGTLVSKALGYEDPAKRKHFEENSPDGGYPSLLTLCMVKKIVVDIEGVEEAIYAITARGKKALYHVRGVRLGKPRDSYRPEEKDE